MKVSTNVIQMIDMFTTDLLHINEGNKNKLIDLEAGDLSKTLYLRRDDRESTGAYALKAIARQIGAVGSTMLRRSALVPEKEQIVGAQVNYFDWSGADGSTDTVPLHKFVDAIYEEIRVKGNNPLFLSVGALSWEVSLGKDEIKKIVDLMIVNLKKRLEDKQLGLDITDSAKEYIIDAGYDPIYGARPLKRFLQQKVETLVAKKIIEGNISEGTTLVVDFIDEELVIKWLNNGAQPTDTVKSLLSKSGVWAKFKNTKKEGK